MTTFAVEYTYDDQHSRRDEVRPTHRAFLAALHARGVLVASGPFTDGAAGALLLVRAADAAAVEAILDEDPFRVEGLVPGRTVRAWDPVFRSWEE